MPPRYAPSNPLPPYAYVPGHDLPHPVTDPRGHAYSVQAKAHGVAKPLAGLAHLPPDAASRRRVSAATLAADPQWRFALDVFNGGWYWEAHEAWEGFWNALGRITPEARFVQGLIHIAAAAVKIREGKPNGIARHTKRARDLLGGSRAAPAGSALAVISSGHGESLRDAGAALGLAPESLAAVVAELDAYKPECWHTSRAPVVRVLANELRLAEERK
jgi:predicted metal-dependent hydrolase